MNKYLSGIIFFTVSSWANTDIGFNYNIKDYSNSKTKTEGTSKDYLISRTFNKSNIFLNYETSKVKRENKVLNQTIESLEVEKISLKYSYFVNQKSKLKFNFINIEENLAPTDNGKIYGIGLNHNIDRKHFVKLDQYLSNYDDFNVYQTDFLLGKKFKINDISLIAKTGLKYINIDGNKYGNYTFTDTNYTSFLLGLTAKYENNLFSATYMKGDRIFSVLGDGVRVQHHAMKQNDTYILSLVKKYKNLQFGLNYSYQIGTELPEKQNDVKTKVTSFQVKYKF